LITGYNTDVRHGNRIFHVQTEDKGMSNPRIETLIYVGGEILDNYRAGYEDLIAAGKADDSSIQSRMDDQHKSVIRDIKNGKYDVTPVEGEAAEQLVFNDRPLDQAILEYLQQEGETDTLELVLDEPMKPTFGSAFKVRVQARLCISQNPVIGADVTVRLVSSLKKASLLLSGKTDGEGLFACQVEMPPSQPGHLAVAIVCASDAGSDEVRALISAA
jgi:hypothetical protein